MAGARHTPEAQARREEVAFEERGLRPEVWGPILPLPRSSAKPWFGCTVLNTMLVLGEAQSYAVTA